MQNTPKTPGCACCGPTCRCDDPNRPADQCCCGPVCRCPPNCTCPPSCNCPGNRAEKR